MYRDDEFESEWEHWQGDRPQGRFAHMCHSWDMMAIDETNMEFCYCDCFEGQDFKEAKARAAEKWDHMEWNEHNLPEVPF